MSSINFKFTQTERKFVIIENERRCVSKKEILESFKKGDTVTIKIETSDKHRFSDKGGFVKFTRLFGISKNGVEFISLKCRNEVSSKRTNAATIASIVSAVLSAFFAISVFKPKNKYQVLGQFPLDPIFVVLSVWLAICLILR